ncbi:MAG: winged helix-turn-helix domain-containing protein [Comamonadaceae bacterium]|nr:winged helix-turn-helix domain-containing protein [Comamonadaceae bacterium]
MEGGEVELTTLEYKLLLTLAERRGRVQTRDGLLQDVWGYHYAGDTRTVDTHITRLRTKLGSAGGLIRTAARFRLQAGGRMKLAIRWKLMGSVSAPAAAGGGSALRLSAPDPGAATGRRDPRQPAQ